MTSVWNIDLLTFKVAPFQCRQQNYMNLTNVGEYALRVECLFGQRHQPLRTTVVVIVILWWTPNDWVGWEWLMLKQGLQLGRVGLICTKPTTHSASQDIRSDWWFVMVAGSVSISFACPPPAPSRCCSPICFCAALQGNQDSDTLWERGRQKDLHTKSGRGIYLICLQSWDLSA